MPSIQKAALLFVMAAACGDDVVRVDITLVRSLSDPMGGYTGLESIDIELSADDRTLATASASSFEAPAEINGIPWHELITIDISGKDGSGTELSHGERTVTLADGDACCAEVCFCSVAHFEAGNCRCGRSRCDPCELSP